MCLSIRAICIACMVLRFQQPVSVPELPDTYSRNAASVPWDHGPGVWRSGRHCVTRSFIRAVVARKYNLGKEENELGP